MAGTDQSVNLTGMLSGIANTIGQGIQINGMNAGQAMGNNIREAAKPQLNMNDPQSIRNYAGWAGRNGQQKEATLMLEKAAELEKNQALAKKEGAADKLLAGGMRSAFDGDVTGLERSISEAAAKAYEASQAGDFESMKMYQQRVQALGDKRTEAGNNQTKNKGNGILHLESLLESPDVTEEQKRQIQTQLGVLKQDNKAVLAANNTKLSNMAVDRQQQAAQEDALEAQAMQQILAVKDPEELLDLEIDPRVAGKLQSIINSREAMLVRDAERSEKAAELNVSTFTEADRAFFESLATQAGEDVDFGPRLKMIEEAQNKAMKDGKWNSEAERTAFLKTQAQFENMMFNEYSAATSQEGRLKRESEDRRFLKYEEAKLRAEMGPTLEDISKYKVGRRGMKDEDAAAAIQAQLDKNRDSLAPPKPPVVLTEEQTKLKDAYIEKTPVPATLIKGSEGGYVTAREKLIPRLIESGVASENWAAAIKKALMEQFPGEYFPEPSEPTPVKDFFGSALSATGPSNFSR